MYTPLLLVMFGCEFLFPEGTGKPHSSETDDTGTTSDDSNGGSNEGFCDRNLSDAAPGGPDCVSQTISCGQTLEGRTKGGSTQFEESTYDPWFCGVGFPSDYSGPERVYLLDVDVSTLIDVSLDSPCSEVDLIAIHWNDDTCPYPGVGISECENSWDNGNDSLQLFTDGAYRFFIVVEPRSANDTNFRLTVDCTEL